MQLSTYDLILYSFSAVVMPLLILANLGGWSARGKVGGLLWGEYPGLMRVSLLSIGLLALWSWLSLAAHFGFVSEAMLDSVIPFIGIAFLVAALAVIWFAVSAVRHYLKNRPSRS